MLKGNTKPPGATSFKETAFGVIPRNQLLELELQGTKKGLDYLYSALKSNQDIKITPELICELHTVSFQWIFPDWAGKFRTIQVTYSGKEAPLYFQVPELIKNLCADLQIRLHNLPEPSELNFIQEVVSLLAWFQYQFVFIHPFQDYNGRMTRMLTTLILLKLKLPPAWITVDKPEDRKGYLKAMQFGDKGDLSLLERIIEKTLARELNKSL
jgi:CRISPR-associated endonuclease/helicase Cas3